MKVLFWATMCTAAAVWAQDTRVVEAFVDKGQLFIKAGTNTGLKVGTRVELLGEKIGDTAERRRTGTAEAVEVFDTLARITPDKHIRSLDDVKFVHLIANRPSEPTQTGSSASGTLSGAASIAGFGPAKRISLVNRNHFLWTHCDLRLPNNRHRRLDALKAGDSESIALPRFTADGPEYDRPLDSLKVSCDQGSGKFGFSL